VLVAESGPEHQKTFTIEARLAALDSERNEFVGRAQGSTKKNAEQDAARQVLEYLAAQSRVRASELTLKAARDERLPSLEINGDYGVIGRAPGDAKQTYSLAGGVRIPIFQGGRTRADIAQAQADLRQRKFQLADLRSRVEFEVRTAWLDVTTSGQQVEVARQSVDLAGQQLTQTQDRFTAGVSAVGGP